LAVSKRAILFIGIITLGLMAAGANAYGGFKRKKRLTDEAELDGDKKVQGSRGMPQMWFNGCNL